MAISGKGDHVFIHLLESAPINIGHGKQFKGVAANLVAFACKSSFEKGYNGIVVFEAKSRLIEHYEQSLGAKRFAANRMFIDQPEAYHLVRQYYKDFT